MKAGKLDRLIVLQRAIDTVSAAGTVTHTWSTVGELRAELVNLASVEAGAVFGEIDTSSLVLRTRYLTGVTAADRIVFDGDFYNIKGIVEIGRRRVLELRVERAK
jgi:SPP1 family predicted phage head-tail adaptor